MKGRTIIELTDVNTGKKELVDSENMVTNALNKFLQPLGMYNPTAFNALDLRNENLLNNLLGGIMLFDSTIDENIDTIQVPAGAKMVGNGSYGVTNSSEVLEFGSYNETESGWQEDGSLKYVYDFNTSQANGEIACVCLSSRIHGYVGEGNSISYKQMESGKDDLNFPGEFYKFQIDKMHTPTNYPRIVEVDIEKSTISIIQRYNIYYNSSDNGSYFPNIGKLNVRTYRAPISKLDIRNHLDGLKLINNREIDIPENFLSFVKSHSPNTSREGVVCNTDATYIIWCTRTDYWAPDGSLMVLKINEDYSLETFEVVNQTGVKLGIQNRMAIINNKIFVRTDASAKVHYVINMENSADFKLIENPAGIEIHPMRKHVLSYGENKLYYSWGVVDLIHNTIYPINYALASHRGQTAAQAKQNPLINILAGDATTTNTIYSYIIRTIDYIATINNLPEPVVKTSDKTMKVTYVLTFDETEENS